MNQTEYNKKWQSKNRDRAKYLSDRSRARSFIRNHSTFDDLDELKVLIEEREHKLKKNYNDP